MHLCIADCYSPYISVIRHRSWADSSADRLSIRFLQSLLADGADLVHGNFSIFPRAVCL